MLMILEWQQRAERRFDDLRTEIGVAVRLEVGNAMQRFEDRLDRIEERLDRIEGRL
jgi:hypothetical protein